MAQSHLLAMRSTCTRLAVGATVVRDKRIIAGGYNGSITGSTHCIDEGCYVIDNHCVRTIHAEVNALLQCAKFGVPTTGAELYVTHFPCLQCCKAIIQSGIKAVYYAKDYKNHPYAIELFNQAGVKVEQVELKEMVIEIHSKEKQRYVDELLQLLHDSNIDKKQVVTMEEKGKKLFSPPHL